MIQWGMDTKEIVFHPQGGYIFGGDPATYFPELWTWMVQEWGINSVLDVGCGEGHALRFFEGLGCNVRGFDLVKQPTELIVQHDFSKGPYTPEEEYDLIWTCEFVEHVSAEHARNLISALRKGKRVVMTHAFPGQGGIGHVNCQPSTYWIGFMNAAGFVWNETETAITRAIARANTSPWNHYVRAGLVFSRVEVPA